MAYILHISGKRSPISSLTLDSLQAGVDGYIERITLSDGSSMYINEEGKLNGLPINEEATRLARPVLMADDYIVGDVVICAPGEDSDDEEVLDA